MTVLKEELKSKEDPTNKSTNSEEDPKQTTISKLSEEQGLTGRVFQLRVGSGSGIGKNYRVGSGLGSGSGIGNIY